VASRGSELRCLVFEASWIFGVWFLELSIQ
jgi:hypothetical protein